MWQRRQEGLFCSSSRGSPHQQGARRKLRSEFPLCMLPWCSLSYMLLSLGRRYVHYCLWICRSKGVLSFPKQLEETLRNPPSSLPSPRVFVCPPKPCYLLFFDGIRKPVSNSQHCQANGPAKDNKPEAALCQG